MAAKTGESLTAQTLDTYARISAGIEGTAKVAATALTVSGVVGGAAGAIGREARIVSPVYRIAGRDVVIVESSVGRQAFYRSSGGNSGMPGKWLPVDEFQPGTGWFNKAAYTRGPGLEEGSRLHRLGTEEFSRISKSLGKMSIPEGQVVPAGRSEAAEMTLNRILDFFGVRTTPTTEFRPVP